MYPRSSLSSESGREVYIHGSLSKSCTVYRAVVQPELPRELQPIDELVLHNVILFSKKQRNLRWQNFTRLMGWSNLEKEGRVQRLLIHNISPCISAKVEPGLNTFVPLFMSRRRMWCTQVIPKEILQINNPPIIELLRKDILPGSWKLLDLVLSHVLA